MTNSRFYVGNLFADISEADLRSLFDRFGTVSSVEIKNKRDIDGNVMATFAFVNFEDLSDVTNVIKQCNHLKWKKQIIRVQLAQESFMQRLQKERETNNPNKTPIANHSFQQQEKKSPEKPKTIVGTSEYDPMALVKKMANANGTGGVKQQPKSESNRRRYYSSSSEDDEPNAAPPGGTEKFLSKLEGFNADFWNDCESKRIETTNDRNRQNNYGNRQYEQNNRFNSEDFNARRQNQTQNRSGFSSNIESDSNKRKVTKLGSDDEEMNDDYDVESNKRFRNRLKESDAKRSKNDFSNTTPIEVEDVEEERKRNLKILGSVLGKPDLGDEKKPSAAGKMFKDPSKLRFDPTSKDHEHFLVNDEEANDKLASPAKTDIAKSVPDNSDQKYWVSSSLSQAFSGTKVQPASDPKSKSFSFGFSSSGGGQTSSNGFSLLNKFGKADAIERDVSSGPKKQLPLRETNPFKFESSDSEDENKISRPAKKDLMVVDPLDIFAQKLKEKASATKSSAESFFFRPSDVRFGEGSVFFTLTQTVDEMRSKHEEQRPLLAQIMKKKLRRRAKKQEKMAFDLKKVNRKGGIKKRTVGFRKKGKF